MFICWAFESRIAKTQHKAINILNTDKRGYRGYNRGIFTATAAAPNTISVTSKSSHLWLHSQKDDWKWGCSPVELCLSASLELCLNHNRSLIFVCNTTRSYYSLCTHAHTITRLSIILRWLVISFLFSVRLKLILLILKSYRCVYIHTKHTLDTVASIFIEALRTPVHLIICI